MSLLINVNSSKIEQRVSRATLLTKTISTNDSNQSSTNSASSTRSSNAPGTPTHLRKGHEVTLGNQKI